jgi:Tfp pilus assembly protein PilF
VSDLFSTISSAQSRLALILALAVVSPVIGHAAEPAQLEEKTSEQLNKLQPLTSAKSWDAALALLDGIQAGVGPNSYDFAVVADIRSKIYMQKGDYSKAIEPMETTVRLGDAYGYFDERDIAEKIYYLVQIYYQEAVASKSPALQQQYFSKASNYIKRWINSRIGRTSPDTQRQDASLFYSSILYSQATANPEKIDLLLLRQAQKEIENGLLASPHPKETFYVLLLATAQQEGNYIRASELLEMLVKQHPEKKDYWTQLIATYLNLALDKDEVKSREYNIRAILATERSQALGFSKAPKDNFNLVGIYINLGQYGKATELLYAGLKNGSIDSTQKNWEYLAFSYQQVDKPYQAVDVLKEAANLYPKAGQLDYQIAQIYYSLDKTDEAYRYLNSAVAKGHLERPSAVYNFLAYIGFEQRRYDEALASVNKALAFSDTAHDTQLPRLKQAIEDAIKEREQLKAAATTPHSK